MLNTLVPEEEREYVKNQLDNLSELQENVIRNAVTKQEELMRKILQQQDFDTQIQSCMHVVKEVESSLATELEIEADLRAMNEKLSHFEVIFLTVCRNTHFHRYNECTLFMIYF